MTHYLKFESEEQAIAVLSEYYVSDNSEYLWNTPFGRIVYPADATQEYAAANNTCSIDSVERLFAVGHWLTASHANALDPVGIVSKPTGVMLQGEAGEYPEMSPIAGWHVNFIGKLTEAQQAFEVFPETPVQVFG